MTVWSSLRESDPELRIRAPESHKPVSCPPSGFGRPKLDVTDGVTAGSGGGGLGDLAVVIVIVVTFVLAVAFVWLLVVLLASRDAALLR